MLLLQQKPSLTDDTDPDAFTRIGTATILFIRQKPSLTDDATPARKLPDAHYHDEPWNAILFRAAPDGGGKLRAGIRHLTEKATPKRPAETAMTG
jgi:hypothetical protein